MEYDVLVVGAGPAGCRTAELIGRQGYSVLVIEEHAEVGKPVQCAGLVSWRLLEQLPDLPKDMIINIVKKANFFSPSERITLKSKKPVYVIDRAGLDKYLCGKAKEVANVKLSTTFEGYEAKDGCVVAHTTKGDFEAKLLVGADGVNSTVARQAKLKRPDNALAGLQTTVDGSFDPEAVELWFGSSVSPGFFAWVIPESSRRARIGLATRSRTSNYFENFLKKRVGKVKKADVAGTMNFGLMQTTTERVLLVGDAACQIKPFSCGGIVYGLIGARYCANACVEALKQNRFDAEFLKDAYDKRWKAQLEGPIRRGLLYRRISQASDGTLDFLFKSGKRFAFLLEFMDMDFL